MQSIFSPAPAAQGAFLSVHSGWPTFFRFVSTHLRGIEENGASTACYCEIETSSVMRNYYEIYDYSSIHGRQCTARACVRLCQRTNPGRFTHTGEEGGLLRDSH